MAGWPAGAFLLSIQEQYAVLSRHFHCRVAVIMIERFAYDWQDYWPSYLL